MMKSTLVLNFIIGVSMLGQTAFAVELRRDHLIIDFPVPPSSGEVVERHEVGSIRRYGAVAQTDTCDYALFEFQYPRRYIQAIGEEGLLAEAVRESVLNHEGQVHSLERGSRGGVALVDVGFTRGTVKGHGNARYLQVDDMVYEAVVLCIAGVRADPQFLRSIRIN